MSIYTTFTKSSLERHDESSIFSRFVNNTKNHTGCTYRGRGGFPSSRLRFSIPEAVINCDRKCVDIFSVTSKPC
jgi:hypothetical protein